MQAHTPPSSNLNCCLNERDTLAKKTITNIAQALACVRKLKSGKACSMAELKASLMLLETAYRTVKANKKQVEKQADFLERQMERMAMFRQ